MTLLLFKYGISKSVYDVRRLLQRSNVGRIIPRTVRREMLETILVPFVYYPTARVRIILRVMIFDWGSYTCWAWNIFIRNWVFVRWKTFNFRINFGKRKKIIFIFGKSTFAEYCQINILRRKKNIIN